MSMNYFPSVTPNINQNNINLPNSAEIKYQIKSPIPKPDFSMIDKKESSFSYKQNGSYKKPKSYIPESPMKSPGQKSFTPVQPTNTNFISTNVSRKKLDFSSMQSDMQASPIKEESSPEHYRDSNQTTIKGNPCNFSGKNLSNFLSNIEIDLPEEEQSSNIS